MRSGMVAPVTPLHARVHPRPAHALPLSKITESILQSKNLKSPSEGASAISNDPLDLDKVIFMRFDLHAMKLHVRYHAQYFTIRSSLAAKINIRIHPDDKYICMCSMTPRRPLNYGVVTFHSWRRRLNFGRCSVSSPPLKPWP